MSSISLTLPAPRRGLLLGPRAWAGVLAAVISVTVLAPVLNLLVPAGQLFHLSDYAVALIGKIMCYAICALAMDPLNPSITDFSLGIL